MPDHHGRSHAASVPSATEEPSTTEEFFAGVSRRGHEPLLERIDQTVRIDLHDDGRTDHWKLSVRRGDLKVSREPGDADCVITTTRDVFERVVTGRTKPLAAWLRNQIAVEGRLYPLLMLDRLLPSPPGAHDPRALAAPLLTNTARTGGYAGSEG